MSIWTASAIARRGSASTLPRRGRTSQRPTSSSHRLWDRPKTSASVQAFRACRTTTRSCWPTASRSSTTWRQGRFQWGVGAGGFPGDLEVFGYGEGKKDHRAMMQRSVTDVLDIWDDPTPGYYSNEFYDYTVPEPVPGIGLGVHVKPYQKPHPPIGISGVSPKSGSLAAAGARGWLPLSINIVPNWVLKTHWEAYSEGAEKAGRQPRTRRLADRPRGVHRRHHGGGTR